MPGNDKQIKLNSCENGLIEDGCQKQLKLNVKEGEEKYNEVYHEREAWIEWKY